MPASDLQAAGKTALAWLVLVDQGKYNESYKQLLPEAKQDTSPNEWTRHLGTYRTIAKKEIKRTQITDPDRMYNIQSMLDNDAFPSNGLSSDHSHGYIPPHHHPV